MYTHFGGVIRTEFTIAAQHGYVSLFNISHIMWLTLPQIILWNFSQPTHNFGAACGSSSSNTAFINNCNYRGAFQVLNHLYGDNLTLPADNAAIPGNLITFDQAEFFAFGPALSAMARDGFVYVPTECQYGAACKLHIVFHGCLQARCERKLVLNQKIQN